MSLWRSEGEVALKYLREERHLSDDVIRKFQFGYCPRGLHQELSGRIIMPIFDANSNLIAFSTRNPWTEKQYQHWHEQFDKSNHLFGIHLAKEMMRRTDEAIIVEGQFDVGYSHTVGLLQTVGLCGSAFTIMHAAMLRRYCSYIYLVLDPDGSGENGVNRALEMYHQYCLRDYELHFIPITLPDKLDPDEFLLKHGRRSLEQIMRERRAKVCNA